MAKFSFGKRKTTGKRTSRKNRMATWIYLAFVMGVSMILATMIIVAANEVFAFKRPDTTAEINVPEQATLKEVANMLEDADIIDHPALFKIFVGITKKEHSFVPGIHILRANMDYRALLRSLTRKTSGVETVSVTIPEGYEIKQIIDLLVEYRVVERDALEETLKNGDFEYAFLGGLKKGELNRLEGYLFPDTYEFYIGDKATRVVEKMLKNFEKRYDESMQEQAKKLGMSTHEVITLASIIERETTGSDRAMISSVFHNRLESANYPYLQSCATVLYALGERKERLSIEDTKVNHPYNTYKNKGLPPGPIASPGIASIEAALYPANSNYLFFALQEDGTHKFSKTYAEHQRLPNVNPN